MRLIPISLALTAIMALTGPAQADGFDIKTMTVEERETFRKEVREYLLANPEVIYDAIQILQKRREEAAAVADRDLVAKHADAIYKDTHSWSNDVADADITVVEFLDYRCGYCKRAHPAVEELLESDPKIKIVVKEFPILGPDSIAAGRMAMAAFAIDPSKYRALSDALMTYKGNLTESAAYQIAAGLGFDIAVLKERAASQMITDTLNKNYQLAQALGVQGTPAFIIGKQIVRGYLPLEDLVAVVAQERAAASN